MDEESIFLAALEKTNPAEQADWLDEACGDDETLKQHILGLLLRHQESQGFLEQPPAELDATIAQSTGDDLAEVVFGESINVPRVMLWDTGQPGADPIERLSSPEIPDHDEDGRYQVQGEIARGGMGAILKGRDVKLGRELAIKVLLDEHKTKPSMIRRFVEEAQITGQLQHPGIAPVYELGQFPNRRPFISMKLVKGETLSRLLADREAPGEDRSRFVGIFEQVCRAMSYAHSRGVIHRDLKPANIMVGAFGEVQVMDWGLAKVLTTGGVADEKNAKTKQHGVSVIETLRSAGSDTPQPGGSLQTQIGSVLGTPAYMAPEQALGEIDRLDQRADVFGLGAILCEILTGKPPYVGEDGTAVFRQATRGKLKDCLARLDKCGADGGLVALAKHCIELEPVHRPSDANAISGRLTEHLESVETRLRETEIERAAQSARVIEEQKRRRVTLALAASVVMMLCLGGGSWIYADRQAADRVAAATEQVNDALTEARLHKELAGAVNLESEEGLKERVDELEQAEENAIRAVELAEQESVDAAIVASATKFWKHLAVDARDARKESKLATANRTFRDELEFIQLSAATGKARPNLDVPVGGNGKKAPLIRLFDIASTAPLYEEAFRRKGCDLTAVETEDAVAWIRKSAIRENLIAALDHWRHVLPASEQRHEKLLAVTTGSDENMWRKDLRVVLSSGEVERLRELAAEVDVRAQPTALITWLGAALREARLFDASVTVLRTAQQHRPGDFWLNHELSRSLIARGEPDKSLGYARAALAIRPHSSGAVVFLHQVLQEAGLYVESEAAARRLIELDSNNGLAHHLLGESLLIQNSLDEAISAFHDAIGFDPNFAASHCNLGLALRWAGKPEESYQAYYKSIELDPRCAQTCFLLGTALGDDGRWDEAVAMYDKAIEIEPDHVYAQINLAIDLSVMGKLDAAIAACRRAIELEPGIAQPHHTLATCLLKKGELNEAIAGFRQTIEIDSTFAASYSNLAIALGKKGKHDEALSSHHKAIELDTQNPKFHNNLGMTLRDQARHREAEVAFRAAVKLDQTNGMYYAALG